MEQQVAQDNWEEVPRHQGKGDVHQEQCENLPGGSDHRTQETAGQHGTSRDTSLHTTVEEDIQDAGAKMMPETCQAAGRFGTLIHFAWQRGDIQDCLQTCKNM